MILAFLILLVYSSKYFSKSHFNPEHTVLGSKHGIKVKDAHWEEMDNGAKRLTALLNGVEYKATVSQKSQRGKAMVADGGTKMDLSHQKKWVEELLLPKYLSIMANEK